MPIIDSNSFVLVFAMFTTSTLRPFLAHSSHFSFRAAPFSHGAHYNDDTILKFQMTRFASDDDEQERYNCMNV